jgi:hypothetical protein
MPGHSPAPVVIGVDGPSGAGKTVLAGRLAAELDDVTVVHVEDLYPGWSGLDAVVPRLVAWVLQPSDEGRPPRWRRWDWAAGRYAEWHELPARSVLVVEGVGAGARACAPYLDLLVWVEAPEQVRYLNAMHRDGVLYRPHWRRWAAAERLHFDREGTRARADVVVSTSGS